MVRTHTHSWPVCTHTHTHSSRNPQHIAPDQRYFCAMVNRRMKCRKSTFARLELNLFPLHLPLRFFFVSFTPSTSLAASPSPSPPLSLATEVRSPSPSAQIHRQRPSFSFTAPLPGTVQPCPLDRCLLLPLSVFLCLYIHPSLFTQSAPSLCVSAEGENGGLEDRAECVCVCACGI